MNKMADKKKTRKSIIKIPYGKLGELAGIFNVSRQTVSTCLNGRGGNTARSKKIRHTALTQYDGQEFTPMEN